MRINYRCFRFGLAVGIAFLGSILVSEASAEKLQKVTFRYSCLS